MTTNLPIRNRHGAAALELAVLLPFLMLIVSAALDYARVFHTTQVMEAATEHAGLYASGHLWTADNEAAARDAVKRECARLDPPLKEQDITIDVDGSTVTVRVRHEFPLLTAVLQDSRTVSLQRTRVFRLAPKAGD